MSIRILEYTRQVDAREWAMIEKGGHRSDWERMQRRQGATAIADALLKDSGILDVQVSQPSPDDDFNYGRVGAVIRFRAGAADATDTAALAVQLAEARAEGMRLAADAASAAAQRYGRQEGHCAGVISHALADLGRKLRDDAEAVRLDRPEPSDLTRNRPLG